LIDRLAAEAAPSAASCETDSREEILARIMTALANEGAKVLEDGFALRAGDIDVVYCYGFGFRAIEAARCSTPTRSACRSSWNG